MNDDEENIIEKEMERLRGIIRAKQERITALETAGRDANELIQYYIVGDKRIYSELNSEEKETIKKISALLDGETK